MGLRRFGLVLAAAGTVLGGSVVSASAATPAATNVEAPAAHHAASYWECTQGYSCYYDGHGGANLMWVAPSCGWHNLGIMDPPLNDRISSVYNRGGGGIQAFDWTDDKGWVEIGPKVPVGGTWDYWDAQDNVIDAVRIDC